MKREPSTDLHDEPLAFWGALLVVVVAGLALATVLGLLFGCARVVDHAPENSQSTIADSQRAEVSYVITEMAKPRPESIQSRDLPPGYSLQTDGIEWRFIFPDAIPSMFSFNTRTSVVAYAWDCYEHIERRKTNIWRATP